MSRYGTTFSARYEDEYEDARAVHSGGPASTLCDFPDSDDAPPRPSSLPLGFPVPHSTESDPLTYEGDQA